MKNGNAARPVLACEIIYAKADKGWKWRGVQAVGQARPPASAETYQLFYECVEAARANGYDPRIKCA